MQLLGLDEPIGVVGEVALRLGAIDPALARHLLLVPFVDHQPPAQLFSHLGERRARPRQCGIECLPARVAFHRLAQRGLDFDSACHHTALHGVLVLDFLVHDPIERLAPERGDPVSVDVLVERLERQQGVDRRLEPIAAKRDPVDDRHRLGGHA